MDGMPADDFRGGGANGGPYPGGGYGPCACGGIGGDGGGLPPRYNQSRLRNIQYSANTISTMTDVLATKPPTVSIPGYLTFCP